MSIDQVITNNVGALAMASLFIYYMNRRDKMFQRIVDEFTRKLEQLTKAIGKLENRIANLETN